MSSAIAAKGQFPLVDQLKDKTTTVILPVATNPARGAGLAPVGHDCVVWLALFGMVDSAAVEIGVKCIRYSSRSA